MAIIKLSVTERRRVSAFFTCVVLAALAWMVVTLSNSYNYTIRLVVNFKNTPQNRAFHSLQPDTVNATVKGSGWQMLMSKMKPENKQVKVDLSSLEKESYVVLSTQLPAINDARDAASKIIALSPDTLYFDFSNRSVRKVPVQLLMSLKYQRQFAQSDNVVIKPAYVSVSGPSNVIDKIAGWKTDSLTLKDVGETVNAHLNLAAPKEGNISIYPKSVEVMVPVNEFTEKTIDVPVKLVNNYNYFNVKVFPLKVKVTFTTSLNKYAAIDEELFEAQADLDMWKLHGYTVLPVALTKLPQFCKVVKIVPKNIDFIIKK